MTLRWMSVNLFFLVVAQWLFFRIAEPSSSPARFEPLPMLLNAGFAIAAIAYFGCFWLTGRGRMPRWSRLLVSSFLFWVLWSVAIVGATQIVLPPNGAGMFYSTSGLQFTELNSTVFGFVGLVWAVPCAANFLVHGLLGRWLFRGPQSP
ncbi:hypothetical protein [Geitlerinema sp. PCC 7407]|uniref:hypothetical protein n=1 Tax=Geitlerinema sp. PCC 7407 TaxID=1173025 RepID=UPI00029FE774|nr:hypothetical protein [Geitlerinema sp. PCC 7407]AFY66621.1 hypothetical protein GEI7407_2141 [Geitlerinema sp. PCC 7407]